MPQLTIVAVVPCYNTGSACAAVISSAASFADAILAINDGSTDDTAAFLASSGSPVLDLAVNGGKGAALAAAFRHLLADDGGRAGSRADAFVTIDGDGQHDPSDIPHLIARARDTGADLVVGVRDPRRMPLKSRIGNHFSRLLFVIGTATFVADTQSGFRVLSRRLVSDLLDRVTWKGYETESEVLWKSIALGYRVASVRISTIYIDENRRSQFDAWRDSTRIASVFAREIAWTVATAALDIAAFIVFWKTGRLGPAPANIASRFVAVATQALFRRDFFRRSRRLMRDEGTVSCVAAFVGHVTLTTMLVAGLTSAGLPVILAKLLAQLAGYLGTFAIVDQVLLKRGAMSGSAGPIPVTDP